jgi:hypothetical protein
VLDLNSPLTKRRQSPLTGSAVSALAEASFLIGDEWVEAAAGSFVLVPAGLTHDFENRGAVRAGVLNFSAPGGFEPSMPAISAWFAENPPRDTAR